MKGFKLLLIGLSLFLLFQSCNDDGFEDVQSELVVEGWIDDGGFPIVIVSRTIPINVNSRFSFVKDSLVEYIGKYAKVTLSDGEQSVILTGKTNKDYFPPFIYTTGRIRGKAGKSYHLTVEWDDMKCDADCTIPESPKDVHVAVENKDKDQYLLKATLDSADNYYHAAFVMVDSIDSRRCLSRMSLLDYGDTMTINHGRAGDKYFQKDQQVLVYVVSMDKGMYEFWKDYDKLATFSSNPLFTYSRNLNGNIVGGIGYWAGYGVSKKGVVIR